MKKRRKKFRLKKIIIVLISFITINLCLKNNLFFYNISKFENDNIYEVIALNKNQNYSGIGQEQIKNQNGYFTTFSTTNNYKKTYIEYKQNGNSTWSDKDYWNGPMSDTGCGITALSIILSGYNYNYTPEDLRKKYYPLLSNDEISNELSYTFNIKNTGFYYDSIHLSKEKMQEHLKTNRPILICVWNKPHNNRWTTESHYMVLLACDDNDMVYISNPNGGENDAKSSGWYKFNELTPFIAKALYIESYN